MTSIQQARNLILSQAKNVGTETVSINEAYNRVLAETIYADRDYPPFNRSAMDGYAVLSSDFVTEKTELILIERLMAGGVASQKVKSGTCIKIMTGAPVPEGADAVVKVEECIEQTSTVAFHGSKPTPKQNIASQGEDAKKGDLLVKKDTLLNAAGISVLAVTGKFQVEVYSLPEIAIISTGNEIVPVDSTILPHQIRDSNSYVLKSLFRQHSINSVASEHVADDKIMLATVIKANLDKDVLILSGGVSKGDADYVPEVLVSLGVKEVFHRVKIKPGAPLWFGTMPNGGVVFGLPGNPVAVQVAFKVFIEPFILKCFNRNPGQPLYLPMLATKNKRSKFEEYFPCQLITKDKLTGLEPTKMNGSGDISATLHSDGIAVHPEGINTIAENETVAFYPWNNFK